MMVVMSSKPDVSRVWQQQHLLDQLLLRCISIMEEWKKGDSLNSSSRVPIFTPLVLTKKGSID